jgi:hypothetical protein
VAAGPAVHALTGARNGAGAAADAKVTSIVAGMAAGADSIDDLAMLRHGAMPAVFGGIRAPSTLGTFLRAFTHGHALQLQAVHRRFLAALAARTPLLPGAGEVAFVDVDSTHRRVYGRAKQGAEYGRFKGIRTLHPLLATVSTPRSRPVIAAVRMRRGKAADSRGAPKFVSEALAAAAEAGCTGTRILRADSQFYNAGVIAACRRAGAHFSVTTGMNPSIKRAVLGIPTTPGSTSVTRPRSPTPRPVNSSRTPKSPRYPSTPRSPAARRQIGSPPG